MAFTPEQADACYHATILKPYDSFSPVTTESEFVRFLDESMENDNATDCYQNDCPRELKAIKEQLIAKTRFIGAQRYFLEKGSNTALIEEARQLTSQQKEVLLRIQDRMHINVGLNENICSANLIGMAALPPLVGFFGGIVIGCGIIFSPLRSCSIWKHDLVWRMTPLVLGLLGTLGLGGYAYFEFRDLGRKWRENNLNIQISALTEENSKEKESWEQRIW